MNYQKKKKIQYIDRETAEKMSVEKELALQKIELLLSANFSSDKTLENSLENGSTIYIIRQ